MQRAKVAIVGSRDWPDLPAVAIFVSRLRPDTIVISGGARGVDHCAAQTAMARGLEVEEYFAEWDMYGKRAGYMRNETMVARADYVVAFWDERSPGTKHTIDLAVRAGKLFRVYVSRPFGTVSLASLGKAVERQG